MASIVKASSSSLTGMRKKFKDLAGDNMSKWFPRHMFVGMKKMQARLRSVDFVIEVHDARIPFSGRNPLFYRTLYAIRPHALVLNKCDLIDMKLSSQIEAELRRRDPRLENIFWSNCKDSVKSWRFVEQIKSTIIEKLQNSPRFHRTDVSEVIRIFFWHNFSWGFPMQRLLP